MVALLFMEKIKFELWDKKMAKKKRSIISNKIFVFYLIFIIESVNIEVKEGIYCENHELF